MSMSDVYGNTQWLKAADLQGRKAKVRISDWDKTDFKQLNGTVKKQVVLSFLGKEKKLGLNVVNANTIASMYGDKFDGWIGKEIILIVSKTNNAQGQLVDCIRIEYAAPTQNPRAAPPPHVKPQIHDELNPPLNDDPPF